MTVNWGIGQGNNALANFGYGVQLGQNLQDRRDARTDRNALLTQRQQELDLRAQQQAQQAQQQQTEQHRADIPLLIKLLDHAQDEPTYQQARQIAQQYGIDISSAPETYGDGAWVAQQRTVLHALQTPEGQQALSNAGKQAADAGLRPGTPEFNAAVRQIITADMAKPYTGASGETRLYTPDPFGGGQVAQAPQGGPAPGAIEDGYRFKGGNPADPNSWEPVAGGGAGNGTGGFRPSGG